MGRQEVREQKEQTSEFLADQHGYAPSCAEIADRRLQPDPFCFNLDQLDEVVRVDSQRIIASCPPTHEDSGSMIENGCKCLPMVFGGRYMCEIVVLQESALRVGWSTGSARPSDAQCASYSSDGKVGRTEGEEYVNEYYGPNFGKVGDIVGTLIDWSEDKATKLLRPRISFMLNGRMFGVPLELPPPMFDNMECWTHPALQLHLKQLGSSGFKVVLRGVSAAIPLRFPVRRYRAMGQVTERHFCPFLDCIGQNSVPSANAADPRHDTEYRCLLNEIIPDEDTDPLNLFMHVESSKRQRLE